MKDSCWLKALINHREWKGVDDEKIEKIFTMWRLTDKRCLNDVVTTKMCWGMLTMKKKKITKMKRIFIGKNVQWMKVFNFCRTCLQYRIFFCSGTFKSRKNCDQKLRSLKLNLIPCRQKEWDKKQENIINTFR